MILAPGEKENFFCLSAFLQQLKKSFLVVALWQKQNLNFNKKFFFLSSAYLIMSQLLNELDE